MAETFDFTEHRSCEIGTIGKTIKSYKVEQIFNEAVESSEDYSEDGVDGDYDGDDRSQRSSNTGYGHEDDIESNSRPSQSEKADERQDSDDS